jgi:peptidoglycan/xylan/chitin deacetylase (PgdA/CDA1 family)
MPEPSTVFLMYHELEVPGRALCQAEAGYARYAVSEHEFRGQMHSLKENGRQGVSVSEALEFSGEGSVAITFDDGSETDLLVAAPILREVGFNATFYVTTGWVGRAGWLSTAQLQELANLGLEIGCHSMTHAYLTDLDDTGLERETAEAKSRLEQIIGNAVTHFSCPGGRYDNRVAEAARAAGYQTVATSRIHANSPTTHKFALGRVAILRDLSVSSFAGICSGKALPRLRAQSNLRHAARSLLGNSRYDRVRSMLLGSEE